MGNSEFQLTVPGKFVLAGEHAVLRGATAVAMPHPEFKLSFSFEPSQKDFQELYVEPASSKEIIGGLIERFVQVYGHPLRHSPLGTIRIQSSIPIGAGLGSSAALCASVTKWLMSLQGEGYEKGCEVATRLEDHFHGKSSGMDVAACYLGRPIAFSMKEKAQDLGVTRTPRFKFFDTHLRSLTKECVLKVQRLQIENPELLEKTDREMNLASQQIIQGLKAYDSGDKGKGIQWVAEGMRRARQCYYAWDLVPDKVSKLEEEILSQGAIAVKQTGAGAGGFLVALWPEHQ